jgi:hypothetical protein
MSNVFGYFVKAGSNWQIASDECELVSVCDNRVSNIQYKVVATH